jgi:hypothetical protein
MYGNEMPNKEAHLLRVASKTSSQIQAMAGKSRHIPPNINLSIFYLPG